MIDFYSIYPSSISLLKPNRLESLKAGSHYNRNGSCLVVEISAIDRALLFAVSKMGIPKNREGTTLTNQP